MVAHPREQQLPRSWKILTSPFFLLFLLVFAGLAGKGAWNMYLKSEEARAGRVDAEHRLSLLEDRQTFLKGEVDRLHTEAGLELAIREAFNVSKDGEKVYVIVDSPSTAPLPGESVTESVLHWFRDLFKKR